MTKTMFSSHIALCLTFLLWLGGCQTTSQAERAERDAALERSTKGRALFEERCRTIAGEKIYRKVQNVESILLLKVRPKRGDRELADRMWPGAAFARESPSVEYIETFLGYEHAPGHFDGRPGVISPQQRGYIASDRRPGALPGYRFVDVINETDGQRYRYTGSDKIVGRKDVNAPAVKAALQANPNYDLNVYRYTLDKTLTTEPPPSYGVTFEDHVIPEERSVGLASSTIKVIELRNNEVLGELTRYAWSAGGPSASNPVPWLTAYRCPDHGVGTNAATRKFVDQILIPRKEE